MASPASTCWPSIRVASVGYTSKRYVVTKNEETYRNVFTIHYPGRRARRRASGQDEPGLRQAEAHGRVLRPALRLGARQLVCAARRRTEGRVELPSHQLLRARRQRMPPDARARRRDRPDAVHQVRSDGVRCRSLARRSRREQGAGQGRAHRAVPRAHASVAASARSSRSRSSPNGTSTSSAPARPNATTRISC